MIPPRVSVVIPVRDRRDLLGETLDALAIQTFTDHEVIVVDDGSVDGSGDVALAAAARGLPVRLVPGDRQGAVAARALGVAASAAPILAFTDSDCVPAPGWLEAGVAAIDAGADVVQGLTRPTRDVRPLERSVWSLRDDGLYATCNVFYRRDAFDAAGGFDGTAGDRLRFRPSSRLRGYGFGEDTLLGWRVRRAGTATFEPEATVFHAVLPPDPGDSVSRAWTIGAFPALLREVPELRQLLSGDLRRGVVRRLPVYGAVIALAAGRRRFAAVCGTAWAGRHWLELSRAGLSTRRRLERLPVLMAVDATHVVALVWGSLRARIPML